MAAPPPKERLLGVRQLKGFLNHAADGVMSEDEVKDKLQKGRFAVYEQAAADKVPALNRSWVFWKAGEAVFEEVCRRLREKITPGDDELEDEFFFTEYIFSCPATDTTNPTHQDKDYDEYLKSDRAAAEAAAEVAAAKVAAADAQRLADAVAEKAAKAKAKRLGEEAAEAKTVEEARRWANEATKRARQLVEREEAEKAAKAKAKRLGEEAAETAEAEAEAKTVEEARWANEATKRARQLVDNIKVDNEEARRWANEATKRARQLLEKVKADNEEAEKKKKQADKVPKSWASEVEDDEEEEEEEEEESGGGDQTARGGPAPLSSFSRHQAICEDAIRIHSRQSLARGRPSVREEQLEQEQLLWENKTLEENMKQPFTVSPTVACKDEAERVELNRHYALLKTSSKVPGFEPIRRRSEKLVLVGQEKRARLIPLPLPETAMPDAKEKKKKNKVKAGGHEVAPPKSDVRRVTKEQLDEEVPIKMATTATGANNDDGWKVVAGAKRGGGGGSAAARGGSSAAVARGSTTPPPPRVVEVPFVLGADIMSQEVRERYFTFLYGKSFDLQLGAKGPFEIEVPRRYWGTNDLLHVVAGPPRGQGGRQAHQRDVNQELHLIAVQAHPALRLKMYVPIGRVQAVDNNRSGGTTIQTRVLIVLSWAIAPSSEYRCGNIHSGVNSIIFTSIWKLLRGWYLQSLRAERDPDQAGPSLCSRIEAGIMTATRLSVLDSWESDTEWSAPFLPKATPVSEKNADLETDKLEYECLVTTFGRGDSRLASAVESLWTTNERKHVSLNDRCLHFRGWITGQPSASEEEESAMRRTLDQLQEHVAQKEKEHVAQEEKKPVAQKEKKPVAQKEKKPVAAQKK